MKTPALNYARFGWIGKEWVWPEFHRQIGHYQDRALVEPVMVTRNGRERVVLLSADEYHRLKKLDRVALAISELSEEEFAAIMAAEVPPEYAHLDEELRS